jgi:general secretion pathway protein G
MKQKGFTIVELLIVIVVIGILAAITIVAYNGVQQRARDAQRQSDVVAITKALEMYYLDHGQYPGTPTETGGSTSINTSWSTTADSSWQKLVTILKPYINQVPLDPTSTANTAVTTSSSSYNYAYFASSSAYCGAAPYQMYILVYRLEGATQANNLSGSCATTPLFYAAASNYRINKTP